ncbi:MAG: hypothetical protein RIA64_08920 [Rhodospirillales bacterium]
MSYFRSPQTTSEKRANVALEAEQAFAAINIKCRIRTKGTSSRLADIRDDIQMAKKTKKKTYSQARKAREIEKGRLLAA